MTAGAGPVDETAHDGLGHQPGAVGDGEALVEAGQVALDGSEGNAQARRDLLVREPLGQEAQKDGLARREVAARVAFPQHRPRDRLMDVDAAGGYGADGVEELLLARGLDQVAVAAALHDQAHPVRVFVLAQHEHRQLGVTLADANCQPVSVFVGQVEVDDHEVAQEAGHGLQAVFRTGRLGHDGKVALAREQRLQTGSKQVVVVDENDPGHVHGFDLARGDLRCRSGRMPFTTTDAGCALLDCCATKSGEAPYAQMYCPSMKGAGAPHRGR
jgi:hypothetical protein